jgi:hypothetical protein
VPVHIKEYVIYSSYETGGMEGGNCWGDEPESFDKDAPEDRHKILELVLSEIFPDITLLEFLRLGELWHDNTETEYEYYGNSTDRRIEYMILSELEDLVLELKKIRMGRKGDR